MMEWGHDINQPGKEPISILATHIAHLLIHRTFAAAGTTGVFPGQIALLHQMHNTPGLSQKELGERMHIRPSTITVLLRRMEKAGLIERRKDEFNQRIIRVYMTEKSEELFRRISQVTIEIESTVLLGFTQEERHKFREYMLRARHNLEPDRKPGDFCRDETINPRKGSRTC